MAALVGEAFWVAPGAAAVTTRVVLVAPPSMASAAPAPPPAPANAAADSTATARDGRRTRDMRSPDLARLRVCRSRLATALQRQLQGSCAFPEGGLGEVKVARGREAQADAPERDHVSVVQRRRAGERRAVHSGAVLRAEVLDDPALALVADLGMAARHRRVAEHDIAVRTASDDEVGGHLRPMSSGRRRRLRR